jgi:transposase
VKEANQKGINGMPAKRKQYDPDFKFKGVMESFQRETTREEVCRKFGVSASMVSRWRQAFQQRGPEVFADQRDLQARRQAQGYEPGESPEELKKLIGELTVQNDILKKSRGLLGK